MTKISAGLISSEASLLGLQVPAYLLTVCSHDCSQVCVACVLFSSSHKDTSHVGLPPP